MADPTNPEKLGAVIGSIFIASVPVSISGQLIDGHNAKVCGQVLEKIKDVGSLQLGNRFADVERFCSSGFQSYHGLIWLFWAVVFYFFWLYSWKKKV